MYKEKEECWELFINIRDSEYSQNNIVVGYFNATLNCREKIWGNIVRDSFRENVEELIPIWDMVDIKLIIGPFT
jgi:hypothetical protein